MNCPADRTPLLPHQREGLAAHSCLQCHGVWFAPAALQTLNRRTSQAMRTTASARAGPPGFVVRHWPCPACESNALQTRIQGELETNRCPNCGGVWLGKAAVEKLLTKARAHSTSTPRETASLLADSGLAADVVAGAAQGTLLVAGEALGADVVFAELLAALF
ncbi:MAG: hypothetical protein EBS84_07495 [Proteobacteria bacterium]|nr:hypothetical protein [Verrucomicrobiota bacterium]NBU08842.1 hypothetical protein [Pseudomonadota bacterium]